MPPPADPTPAEFAYVVNLAPKDAVAWFRRKDFIISDGWLEVARDAHARAFTVARLARFDLLAQTRAIIDRKLAEGLTIRDAAEQMETAMQDAGWWGREIRVGADGGAESVQLGSPGRIQTILRTNISSAYAAGAYEAQKRTAETQPYWKYQAVIDSVTRAAHARLNGRIFRHDDPVWDSIYPPNGFNCRCSVTALTEKEARRQGGITTAKIENVTEELGVNKRTGEIVEVPGVKVNFINRFGEPSTFRPDPGWSYNPGAAGLPPITGPARPVGGQPGPDYYGLPSALPRARAPRPLRRAANAAGARAAIERAAGLVAPVAAHHSARKWVDAPDERVLITPESFDMMVGREGNPERYANRILPTLEKPDEVWLSYYADGEYRKHYVKGWRGKGAGWTVVSDDKRGGKVLEFANDAAGLAKFRRGHLLHDGHPKTGPRSR